MKLYRSHGIYVSTQDEARKRSKTFDAVEVPTDKPGLIAFLNTAVSPAEQPITTDIGARDSAPAMTVASVEAFLAEATALQLGSCLMVAVDRLHCLKRDAGVA